MNKNEDSDSFFEMEYKHENPVVGFDMRVLTSLLYVSQRMNEKHPSTCCSAAKHPKHSKLSIANIREKPVNFFGFYQPGCYVHTLKIFV